MAALRIHLSVLKVICNIPIDDNHIAWLKRAFGVAIMLFV